MSGLKEQYSTKKTLDEFLSRVLPILEQFLKEKAHERKLS